MMAEVRPHPDTFVKEIAMNDRELLIQEIKGLPDFLVDQLLGIVRYVKIGVENEYISRTDDIFYNSDEFKGILSESISEYRQGKTDNMDI